MADTDDPARGRDPGDLARLADEVADLRSLVGQLERRLRDDTTRQDLYDELYRQLTFARQGLAEQFVAPMAREILLLVDRIDAMSGDVSGAAASVLDPVREELLEVLHRRGLREVDVKGTAFDPRVHEAVARVPVESGDQVGRVVEVRRPGYVLEERVLRPAQVVVGCEPPPPA